MRYNNIGDVGRLFLSTQPRSTMQSETSRSSPPTPRPTNINNQIDYIWALSSCRRGCLFIHSFAFVVVCSSCFLSLPCWSRRHRKHLSVDTFESSNQAAPFNQAKTNRNCRFCCAQVVGPNDVPVSGGVGEPNSNSNPRPSVASRQANVSVDNQSFGLADEQSQANQTKLN